jgi:uncharacterized membrane protein HdeD (DUF308 family)
MTTTVAGRAGQGVPWWLMLIQGIAMVLIGLMLLFNPVMTVLVIVVFIGASWFVSGVTDLISLIWDRSNLVWKVISGVIGIWAGLAVLAQPLMSTILLPTIYVLILGITGIIFGAVQLYQGIKGAGWGALALGIVNIIIGFLLVLNPLAGAIVLPFVFGIFAIAGGIAAIIAAFRAR